MHSPNTIVWWSLWGLIVGIGVYGLKEGQHQTVHWIMAIPLLTGAIAAAVMRLKHEYHEAILHAKWVGISTVLFFLASGYLYMKAEAFGPFATAGKHKAFLGSTFEMSVHEVERSVGRKLETTSGHQSIQAGLKEWVFAMLPAFDEKTDVRLLPELLIHRFPGQARFEFISGKLGRVEIQFQPTITSESAALVQKLQDDFEKEYRHVDASVNSNNSSMLYRKEAVDAVITQTSVDPRHQQISVVLQYLPMAENRPGPLTVDAKVF